MPLPLYSWPRRGIHSRRRRRERRVNRSHLASTSGSGHAGTRCLRWSLPYGSPPGVTPSRRACTCWRPTRPDAATPRPDSPLPTETTHGTGDASRSATRRVGTVGRCLIILTRRSATASVCWVLPPPPRSGAWPRWRRCRTAGRNWCSDGWACSVGGVAGRSAREAARWRCGWRSRFSTPRSTAGRFRSPTRADRSARPRPGRGRRGGDPARHRPGQRVRSLLVPDP